MRSKSNKNAMLGPDDLTVEVLRAAFDSCCVTTGLNDRGELILTEGPGCVCWVLPMEDYKIIHYRKLLLLPSDIDLSAGLEMSNRINAFPMIKAHARNVQTGDGDTGVGLIFIYDAYTGGGVSIEYIVQCYRWFVFYVNEALQQVVGVSSR